MKYADLQSSHLLSQWRLRQLEREQEVLGHCLWVKTDRRASFAPPAATEDCCIYLQGHTAAVLGIITYILYIIP